MVSVMNRFKTTDRLALATYVMTALCFIAMVLPDMFGWIGGKGSLPFFSTLLLFAPIIAFGIVAARRRSLKKNNAMFFVKVAAVSQFVIAILVIALIKIMQIIDEDNSGNNIMAYLWILSTIVTFVLYLMKRKKEKNIQKEEGAVEEGLKIVDHVWAVAPLALFAILFFLNIIITARSQKIFYMQPPEEMINQGTSHGVNYR